MIRNVVLNYECDSCGKRSSVEVPSVGIIKIPHKWSKLAESGKPKYLSEKVRCWECQGKEQN